MFRFVMFIVCQMFDILFLGVVVGLGYEKIQRINEGR